jgi:hypothetical protein
MQTLTDDILLLAIRPNGSLSVWTKLPFAVSGSELVRLAAAGRVDIVEDRIVVLDQGLTGDPLLDAALHSMQRRRYRTKAWVALSRKRLESSYLARLEAFGVVRSEVRRFLIFSVTKWYAVDNARVGAARARLDGIVRSTGPISADQAAFAGLVHAIGLDAVLYPGRAGGPARERLEQVARRDQTESAVRLAARQSDESSATDAPNTPVAFATDAAVHASTHATSHATSHAAAHAATHSAVQAAVDAAVSAAITASVDAAHHSASQHGGSSDGGHHH